MPALVVLDVYHGAGGSQTPTQLGGGTKLHFNRQDDEATGSPVPVPVSGSAYSNFKQIRRRIVTPGGSTITNWRIWLASALPSGLVYYTGDTNGFYQQCTGTAGVAGNRPPDVALAPSSPPDPDLPVLFGGDTGAYTIPVAPASIDFDFNPYDGSAPGPFGNWGVLVAGISQYYAGSRGVLPTPDLHWGYDEA